MKKILSLVLSFIFIFNFIIPCICPHSFTYATEFKAQGAIPPEGAKISYTDTGNNTYPYASFKVQKSGLYTFNVKCGDKIPSYNIVNSSNQPLACADFAGSTSLPSSNDINSKTVTVYLKAGEEYKVPIYELESDSKVTYVVSVEPVENGVELQPDHDHKSYLFTKSYHCVIYA